MIISATLPSATRQQGAFAYGMVFAALIALFNGFELSAAHAAALGAVREKTASTQQSQPDAPQRTTCIGRGRGMRLVEFGDKFGEICEPPDGTTLERITACLRARPRTC